MTEKTFVTWTFDNACKEMGCNVIHSADISVTENATAIDESDLIIFGVFAAPNEDKASDDTTVPDPVLSGKAKEYDETFGGALSDLMVENYKKFKHGAAAGTATPTLRIVTAGAKAKKIIFLGLGIEGKDTENSLLAKIGSTIAAKCDESKAKKCAVVLNFDVSKAPLEDLSAEFYNAHYSDNRYRTGDNVKLSAEALEAVTIVAEGGVSDPDAAGAAIKTGKALASGVFMAKDIVNAPHNVLNSESMANVARKIAEESGGTIKCTILGKEECEKRGMGAYLGVARGSETAPQFIHLTYTPKSGKVNKKVGIVGKGLLFDTGGYNIKTAGMILMKFDCGGAVRVFS